MPSTSSPRRVCRRGSARRCHQGGEDAAQVVCFAPAVVLAKRLIANGADALIIEGSEAGGHIGPVSTSVLAQEILPPVVTFRCLSPAVIGRGEAIVSFLEMGAAGVQMGTRFVCATESIAHPNFKQAFIRAAARDAMPSVQLDTRFPVIPVRALANHGPKLPGDAAQVLGKFTAANRPEGRAARDRALLGGRAAPGGHRRRCRERFADGRPERRYGDARADHGGDPRELVGQAVASSPPAATGRRHRRCSGR